MSIVKSYLFCPFLVSIDDFTSGNTFNVTPESPFSRFKSVGYCRLPSSRNEVCLIAISYLTTLPYMETTLTYMETILPYMETTLPYMETALPYMETILPYMETTLPYMETALPYMETALPYMETTLPY